MASFLNSPSHIRILGFNLLKDQNEYFLDEGVITVTPDPRNAPGNSNLDPLLLELDKLKRIRPIRPKNHVYRFPFYTRSSFDSKFDANDEVPEAILNIQLSCLQFKLYPSIRRITHEQAHIVSNIKRIENVAQNTMKLTAYLKKDIEHKKEKLISSLSLLHQEVTKTKFYIQGVFETLEKVQTKLDSIIVDDIDDLALTDFDVKADKYPNLYKLTYRQRPLRPKSYHQNLHKELNMSEARPRCSLDLPSDTRSWGFSRSRELSITQLSNSPYLRPNSSVSSLSHEENTSSLVAGAVSKVHFATSKAYRHNPVSEAMTPINSGSSDGSSYNTTPSTPIEIEYKKKGFSLRSTLSLANLKALKKSEPKRSNLKEDKPLNARDRLSQIVSSPSQSNSRNSNPNLIKWLPNINMFRSNHNNLKSNLNNEVSFKRTELPVIPKLESIDYHIDISTHIPGLDDLGHSLDSNPEQDPTITPTFSPRSLTRSFSSSSHQKLRRRTSLRSLLLDYTSVSSPSPLQNETF